ncbi:unnamed protein product [Aphanomyces euteiches]|uniref:A-kinase anchor protein 7-like phosphoesterase domain-containing protein n=1 Tax=Aphanomyces euteiches TaxID=100861 RepID=A0A6G0WQ96_9STRA|nr:hypothetical protein Ae201684_012816 [Aphanomyces euteiches]KAH9097849.1 hypothetical protein Ae201684P_001323 [Aphanomyces euteiches]KAH9144015.1 hypothetical protein AeRB84_012012 [Aphanomyces euteiches]
MQACARLQETLVTRDPRLLSALIPLEKLHTTLCMVNVSSATEIATVHRVVAENQHLVNEYMTTEDHSIALNGVSTFGNRVLYAQVDSTAIRSVATMLQQRLRENGVNLVGNHEPFQAHVTLCKLSGRNHSIDASIDGDLMADCPLGSLRINTIDFCAVGSKHLDPSTPRSFSRLQSSGRAR